jgi:hypothetical protein
MSKDIDEAMARLTNAVISDEKNTNITWNNWNLQKAFDQNQEISLNGNCITYNYVNYSYDQITVGDFSEEDRVIKRKGFIIVYTAGAGICYIIDQNSSAKKLLRKLLSYNGRNELGQNAFGFTNDFFIWLIYRVYNTNYNIEICPDDKILKLDAIKGFKGDTDDLQTKVSASGETVMNIISTLSFLLESNNLNQVKLDLNYTGHTNISLNLQKGTVNALMEEYIGSFDLEKIPELKIAKLYLTIYLEILPMLFQEYNSDIGNELWNKEIYKNFLKNVGETLTNKVESKISSLDKED